MLLISFAAMLCLCFLTGIAAQRLLQLSFRFSGAVMMGFLSLLAVFQLIAYPMMKLDLPFHVLFWCYSAVLLLAVIAGCFCLLKKNAYTAVLDQGRTVLRQSIQEFPLVLLALTAAGAALFVYFYYVIPSTDDSYYLARAMEVLREDRLSMPQGFGWSGIEATSFPISADASTLEFWKAYWSRLFHLELTVFTRIPFSLLIYVILCASAYQAYQNIAKWGSDSVGCGCAFLFVYLSLLLIDSWHGGTVPFWILRLPSQGKSILASIILPALIYGCGNIVSQGRTHISWQKWLLLSIILTAGIASSITGIFLTILCCFSLGIPYLLLCRWKDLPKLFLPLLLTCLPVILFAIPTILQIATATSSTMNYFSYETPSWIGELNHGVHTNRLDLLLVCLAFIAAFGSKNAKYILLGGTAAMMIGVLNPALIGFVSKYLTTASAYYRLFWMTPIYISIAYAAAEIIASRRLKVRQLASCCILLFLIFGTCLEMTLTSPAQWFTIAQIALKTNTLEISTNPYKLPSEWYRLGITLLQGKDTNEDVRIMWMPPDTPCLLRQYSDRIQVVGACRQNQWRYFDQPLGNASVAPIDLYNIFDIKGAKNFPDPQWAREQLLLSGIEYLCVHCDSGFAVDPPDGFEFIDIFHNVSVFRVLPM